jgi:hypothetical protein
MLRVQTQSNPEGEDGSEGDGGQEIASEFVVTGCNPSEVLEPAEGVLDKVSRPVAGLVEWDLALAVGFPWDDGPCPLTADQGA